nr:immunoglobulin heavy chain junction region [Mus musculus]MBK4196025.1 immunoglobulin heavy chain junction region [Mus musculus]MBK4196026.1 immunoglobulin heavy chain junction region [Mus musculus]MBK4196027.1 immunoglobulin heavy chain junction region [Mus musculus]MBK4196028.1 immunoglobulin heavy chain junction region [Mus musculus]
CARGGYYYAMDYW